MILAREPPLAPPPLHGSRLIIPTGRTPLVPYKRRIARVLRGQLVINNGRWWMSGFLVALIELNLELIVAKRLPAAAAAAAATRARATPFPPLRGTCSSYLYTRGGNLTGEKARCT